MKRLVICFDGTWKRAQDTDVSNVEKIARTVRNEVGVVQQTVYYVGGVGASYRVDRVLGGSLGLGLNNNLMSAYRFLALNFSPGDQVFVFGFSRGAFTARSLVGMIDRVGLVRADALIKGALQSAEANYRHAMSPRDDRGDTAAEFKHDFCHEHVCLPFLGVFDTVEALGPRARFHRIDFLADTVAVGRQALAIDERRRMFWPRLWTGQRDLGVSGRVRQVWFEGCHSDVGGGVPETGLPDTALLWMIAEASRQGLEFDLNLAVEYLTSGSRAKRHNSMNPGYRMLNLLMHSPLARSYRAFSRGWRIPEPTEAVGVQISSSALAHLQEGTYPRPVIQHWLDQQAGQLPVADVIAFPELAGGAVRTVLQQASADAAAHQGARHACPSPHHPPPPP